MQISHATLRVSDVARSADFYTRLVGLSAGPIGTDHAELTDPGSGELRLELIAADDPGRAPDRAAGLFHVAYLYPGRAGLGAALKRIADGSYEFVGASDHAVSEALYVQDPDNLGIELYRDRPRDEWPMEGDRVAMVSEPLALGPIAAEAAAGEAEATAAGVRIGHVHLRTADLDEARDFWLRDVGLELMAELPGALFMAADGYHHHIGANTWHSAGADPVPGSAPGLDAIHLSDTGSQDELVTPEGIRITRS